MILAVSDVKRSLAFYEAALKPLRIQFFMPYKGEDGHPDLWGFGAGDNISPRARLEYYPGYYAADVIDPDGYSFEVVHKN
jgi:catechol 2,3-dioxygenase-like lactoylglutathione lyase family enzyme